MQIYYAPCIFLGYKFPRPYQLYTSEKKEEKEGKRVGI